MNDSFFEVHPEGKIAFKKLSKNDSGLKPSGHQTHIGLSIQLLEFMPNTITERAALLLCEDYCDILDCEYGKIHRKSGKIDAPNLKAGNKDKVTVVNKIREFVGQKTDCDWFLAWFGLKSQEIVFWLMSSDSKDYAYVKHFFTNTKLKVYDYTTDAFQAAIKYLEPKINIVSTQLQLDIEKASLLGSVEHHYNAYDVEKALSFFKETGNKGEELVNEYLQQLVFQKQIEKFVWKNQSRESGLPYDFIINGNEHIDVKSTVHGFDAPIYFSENEIEYIQQRKNHNKYSVYRVYDLKQENRKLQVCRHCLNFMQKANRSLTDFSSSIDSIKATVRKINIAVTPTNCFTVIENPIII